MKIFSPSASLAPLLLAALTLSSCAIPANNSGVNTTAATTVGWSDMDAILARIHEPEFPTRDFPITNYGAVADGQTDSTDAIRQAIEACNAAGGGRVVVPDGVFATGAIHLLSNVNLHLSDNATLKFIPDPAKYLPVVFVRWEGTECLNYSPLIYAFQQKNIAVTGNGTLDGSATTDTWWGWIRPAGPDRTQLVAMGQQGVPAAQRVFGDGHYLRPNFIVPFQCENVLIEGVTIHNSPMWEVNPEFCTNVIVRGLNIASLGPNNDGCDPESCRDVLIENCTFQTGDDCIAIKSGRYEDGRRLNAPSENLVIRGCTMKDGHGGVTIGSEISGGCRNVFVENCHMDSPNLQRALRLKDNAQCGGVIENIFMRNVDIGHLSEAVLTVDFTYEVGANGPYKPVARNINLENVNSTGSPRVIYMSSLSGAVFDQVHFKNCAFRGLTSAEQMQYAGNVTFDNVTFEPQARTRSQSTRPNPTDQ